MFCLKKEIITPSFIYSNYKLNSRLSHCDWEEVTLAKWNCIRLSESDSLSNGYLVCHTKLSHADSSRLKVSYAMCQTYQVHGHELVAI